MQYPFLSKEMIGSEDCLYLNIFVPQVVEIWITISQYIIVVLTKKKIIVFFYQDEINVKKAVMVFIHGGSFNYGSASVSEFSPDYLLDENVIVVTINYRLNILGKYTRIM